MKNATLTTEQVSSAKTAELVAFYNANVPADKQIKKFADRATAEKRVNALVKEINAAKPAKANADDVIIEARTGEDRRSGKRGSAAHRKALEGRSEIFKKRLTERLCPYCGGSDQTPAGAEGTRMGDHYSFCHNCGVTYDTNSGLEHVEREDSGARAAAIAASWADPEVAAARAMRDKVKVHGEVYRSVREAFKALKLPDSQHIKFRMQLKAAGRAIFDFDGKKHTFTLVRE